MMLASAASTIGDTWNGRLSDSTQCVAPQPSPENVRLSPPRLAPVDLTQGTVLVVIEDAILAFDLQRLLQEVGYRVVGPATTVAEIQRMIQRGDVDCAILDLDIDRRSPLPVADLLTFANVPFVYLTTGVFGPVPARHRCRPVVEKPFDRDALLAAVERAMARSREMTNHNQRAARAAVVPWERIYPPL